MWDTIAQRVFYPFQCDDGRSTGWKDAMLGIWEKKKLALQEEFARIKDGVVVMLDAWFDSFKSGYHCITPI